MKQGTDYVWFIEPLNKLTNESLAQVLPEENFEREIAIEGGTRHNLWRCDSTIITAYRNSKSRSGFQFRIYNRYRRGPIRECTFLKRKRGPQSSTKKPPQ